MRVNRKNTLSLTRSNSLTSEKDQSESQQHHSDDEDSVRPFETKLVLKMVFKEDLTVLYILKVGTSTLRSNGN